MIEVGELKRLLGKFPGNFLAIAIEDSDDNGCPVLGIFTPKSPYNPLPSEPCGYIGMRTWGDAAIFVDDGVEEIGENDTTEEEKP